MVQNELLKGHLGITKELLAYHSVQKHFQIGCEDGGDKLLLVCFLFHADFKNLHFLYCPMKFIRSKLQIVERQCFCENVFSCALCNNFLLSRV